MKYPKGTILTKKDRIGNWYWRIHFNGDVHCYQKDGEYMHKVEVPNNELWLIESEWDIITPKEKLFDNLYERMQ